MTLGEILEWLSSKDQVASYTTQQDYNRAQKTKQIEEIYFTYDTTWSPESYSISQSSVESVYGWISSQLMRFWLVWICDHIPESSYNATKKSNRMMETKKMSFVVCVKCTVRFIETWLEFENILFIVNLVVE